MSRLPSYRSKYKAPVKPCEFLEEMDPEGLGVCFILKGVINMSEDIPVIRRITVKGGKVYLAYQIRRKGQSTTSGSEESKDLTRVYQQRGLSGVNTEILLLCAQGKVRLVGNHPSVADLKQILMDPDNLKDLNEVKTDILLDDLHSDQPDADGYVIKMKGDTYLVGVARWVCGDRVDITPISSADQPYKDPKRFVLKEQAKKYLEEIKKSNFDTYYSYMFEIVKGHNNHYFVGIQKVAKWCEKRNINIHQPKKAKQTARDTVKVFVIGNNSNPIKLESHFEKSGIVWHKLTKGKETIIETKKQLEIIDELDKRKDQLVRQRKPRSKTR